LASADLYVALISTVRQQQPDNCQLLDLQTEPACWRSWTGLAGERDILRPDLYLAVAVGQEELRWFIEVDLGSEHRPALLRKAAAYQRYYDSGIEQDRDGVFPKVAWVVPDAHRADRLLDAWQNAPWLNQELFAVVEADNAAQQLIR
jgi:hypothetical protein